MSAPITARQALEVLKSADLLHSTERVNAALDLMAHAISDRLRHSDPVVLVVMNGALIPAGQLLIRLDFPFQVGYLHATRYRGETKGGALHWIAPPSRSVEGRVVLVVDDIFDEGITLKAIVENLKGVGGAREVLTACLVNKRHDRKVADFAVDFTGLEVADRYVFGCGMDYCEYLRHLPGIYALKDA
ncbi:MAG: hypoxanthine-guanine phosphoribosyltransferase [Candidatus Competibacterales bacterium]